MYNTFSPALLTATISVTATSGDVALPTTAFAGAETVLVTNNGPDIAFFRFGVGAQTALVTDTPILPYTALVVKRDVATHVAAICNTTETATLYFTAGTGG